MPVCAASSEVEENGKSVGVGSAASAATPSIGTQNIAKHTKVKNGRDFLSMRYASLGENVDEITRMHATPIGIKFIRLITPYHQLCKLMARRVKMTDTFRVNSIDNL